MDVSLIFYSSATFRPRVHEVRSYSMNRILISPCLSHSHFSLALLLLSLFFFQALCTSFPCPCSFLLLKHGSSHAGDTSAHQTAHESTSGSAAQYVGSESRGPLLLRVLVALSVSDHVCKVQCQRNSNNEQPRELEGQDTEDSKENPDCWCNIESCPEETRVHRVKRPAWLIVGRCHR